MGTKSPPRPKPDNADADSVRSAVSDVQLPPALERLATLLEKREHVLAAPAGDDELARDALAATKGIFDLGVSLEAQSHPHLHPFLSSIMDPPRIETRSAATKIVGDDVPVLAPEELLPYTPLGELTTEDMDAEQVWSQLELRAEGICAVVKEVGSGESPSDMDDEEEEESEEEGSEEGSEEEMTAEEWERMMAEEGYEEGESDEEGEESGSDGEIRWNSDEEMEGVSEEGSGEEGSEEGSEDEEGSEEGSEDEEGSDEDGDEEEEEGSDIEMEDAEDDDDASSASAGSDDRYAPGPSKPRGKMHATLDDQFFSIDEFNRLTEEQEAGRVTSGALGGDEDEEAELDDFGDMFLKEGDDDAEIMYSDFFEPPPRVTDSTSGKKDESKKKRSKKSKVTFVEEPEEQDEDAERDIMERVKGDLFDDSEDEDEGGAEQLSTHEKRQRELARQIAELEQEAIGPKDWTLMGEATARARPENSLLEEDLDFEHVAKVVPTITEESVATLEEMIKRRILDNNFDSPVRVRAFEPTAFLPSRFFELNDQKSTQSLAQIYEEEYTAAASGGKVTDARDAKLQKEHDEIDRLWSEVSYKLDALSSLHFVPKAPKAQITTIDNIATTSMETALPATQTATSMLAPQEVFAGPTPSELVARSEQTPEEAKAARARARRSKKAERAKLAATEALYGKKRKSAREEKDEALKNLVKTGKGVTVLGKGAKEDNKRRKREQAADVDAKRLKL